MHIEHVDEFTSWLIAELTPVCDAEPGTLAKYVLALLRKPNKSDEEMRAFSSSQLEVFLQGNTKKFVDKMFAVLKDGSYVPKKEPSPIPEEVVKERVAKREEVRKKEREVPEPKPSRESARSSDHSDDRRKPIPEKVPKKEDLPPPIRNERPPRKRISPPPTDTVKRDIRETVRDGREPLREPRRRSRSRSPHPKAADEVDPPNVEIVGLRAVMNAERGDVVITTRKDIACREITVYSITVLILIPPPGYHPPNPPPPGVEPIFTGPPPAPRPVEGYNPEAPSLSGPDFSMPPPPLPVPINTAPWRPSPYAVPTTANVVVPTGVQRSVLNSGVNVDKPASEGAPPPAQPPKMATIENSKFVNQELKETREKIIEAKRKLKAEKLKTEGDTLEPAEKKKLLGVVKKMMDKITAGRKEIHDLSAKLKSCTESIAELEKVIASETTSHKEKSSNSDGRDSGDVDAKRVSTVVAVRRVKAVMDGGLFKGAMLDVTWHRRSGGSGENSPLSADKMLASILQSE
ncbi:hypothetical protein OSTOST_07988, partial [Ostertagia ostertagi]